MARRRSSSASGAAPPDTSRLPGPELNLRLAAPIATWDEAVPLGNGLMGGLLWGGDSTLRLSLDRGEEEQADRMGMVLAARAARIAQPLADELAATARRLPEAVAWDFLGTTSTYRQFGEEIDRWVAGIVSRAAGYGVVEDDAAGPYVRADFLVFLGEG